ncbi:MAG: hypothetical protein ACHQVK_03310 [Candidatus Paceibacterales bacterium]
MTLNGAFQEPKNEKKVVRHYYGDFVRVFFLAAAVIMLTTLPTLNSQLPVPLNISILIILLLTIIAGLANPLQKWTGVINTAVSILGFVMFERYAMSAYIEKTFASIPFLTNQSLALIFLLASYFATKTLRAFFLKPKE